MLLRFLADLVAKQHRQQSSFYLVPVRAVCRGLKDIYFRQYIVKWQRQEGRLVVCRARPQGRRREAQKQSVSHDRSLAFGSRTHHLRLLQASLFIPLLLGG